MAAPTGPDVIANRRARKWSRRELAVRVLWSLAHPLFAFSPRHLWGWRCWLLRRFGARIGRGVRIYPSVRIPIPWNLTIGDHATVGWEVSLYALGRIEIGEACTVSQGAHLCAGDHDWRRADRPLRKRPIRIGAGAWICADAFVGPGVAVGRGAIVGARAVAMRDVAENAIVAGNPARAIGTTDAAGQPSGPA